MSIFHFEMLEKESKTDKKNVPTVETKQLKSMEVKRH